MRSPFRFFSKAVGAHHTDRGGNPEPAGSCIGVKEFLASSDGLDLSQAFMCLPSPKPVEPSARYARVSRDRRRRLRRLVAGYAMESAQVRMWEGPNAGEVWRWDPTKGQQLPGGLATDPLHFGCGREGRQLQFLFIHR
jgi:hypothetical protein